MGLYNDKETNHQFFDLGSGGGKLVIQSSLELPSVSRSVGIELSPTRHKIASQRLNELKLSGDFDRIKKLANEAWGVKGKRAAVVDLCEGDLFHLDISKATHIYVSSLCFSEEMLQQLVDKLENEGSMLQCVASLRMLPLSRDSIGKVIQLGINLGKSILKCLGIEEEMAPLSTFTRSSRTTYSIYCLWSQSLCFSLRKANI